MLEKGGGMTDTNRPRRSLWMYGLESEEPSYDQRAAAAAQLSQRLGVELTAPRIPAADELVMTEDYGDGSTFTSLYTVPDAPQSFTQARGGTDFGSSPWDGSYSYTPPAAYVKIAAYTNVSLTSYSGHTATLWSWWVHHQLLANTEQQSGSDWVAVPAGLSSGGASFQTFLLPQSAQGRH